MRLKPVGHQRFMILDDDGKPVLDVEFGERIWPLKNGTKIEIACGVLEVVERALKCAEKSKQTNLFERVNS